MTQQTRTLYVDRFLGTVERSREEECVERFAIGAITFVIVLCRKDPLQEICSRLVRNETLLGHRYANGKEDS